MTRSIAACVIALAAATIAAAQPQAPPTTTADRFGWLAGCWGGTSGPSSFREIWTMASPDLMIGMSTTVQPARPASFEFLRIVRADGAFAYVAQPGGAPPTSFRLADLSKPDVNLFVNAEHDFPKRVGYQKVDANTLLAWIDGGEGSARKIEYPMTRGKGC